MQALKRYIQHFIDLEDKEWEALSSLFQEVHYKKGEHIYGDSEISECLYFITDGIVRSYKLEEE